MTAAEEPAHPPVELAYRDHPGPAPAVVALHGLASNARWWDLVAAALHHRVVAPDLRGHGESPKPVSGYGFDEVSDDVAALLDRLELGRVLIAGHSWGASVALQLAADHPDRVLGCVCVDGGIGSLRSRIAGGWPEAEVAMRPPDLVGVRRYQVEAWARGPLAEGSDSATAARILLGNFEPLDPAAPEGPLRPRLRLERHMQIAKELFELDGLALLKRVRSPVVAVLADGPESAWMETKREGAEQARLILGDRLRVVWVEGDHDLPVQHPAAVAREISAALAASTPG
jgi:pimeloyl-ACP methyl ester carboxylesterase